ncbi:DUF2760 domain-containing protein [Thermodesulforhabdus norvegica]|uniref:DUF2760 domain-containing protein n=1 Tax=Thermodesulforhabdus norvegica TaxID=39841 RepID=A0A1I4SSV8_9BACT|nr:DUF2760 domain-containing protein [Thermodesulforhabdus norvegica]SFM67628.1 protein of unknown function [Thermodesulforhabdus norvegica]
MKHRKIWIFQALIISLLFNGMATAALFWPLREALGIMKAYVKPLLENQELKSQLPESLLQFVNNMRDFTDMITQYSPVFLFGVMGTTTLLLWIALSVAGARRIGKAVEEATRGRPEARPVSEGAEERKPPAVPGEYDERKRLMPAVQLLALLQREGRFVDFIQEDLTPYDDAQIGAAVRALHEDWRRLFREHVHLETIYREAEGSEVTVAEGFDSAAVRLTGRVIGSPPFHGILRHRGWRLIKLDLPQVSDPERTEWIIAPAEVEVEDRTVERPQSGEVNVEKS